MPEALLIKAADMLIARRADTRARAEFATWKMLAKLNGMSSLTPEAQDFLARYKTLMEQMPEPDAAEATIKLMYASYYAEMGGAGTPPELPARPRKSVPDSGNVTTFRRLPPKPQAGAAGQSTKPRLPVALIFTCLVVVYVGIRLYWR